MKIIPIDGGNKLERLFIERLMTKGEFAEKVPVSSSLIMSVFRGNRTTVKTARAICNYLQIEFVDYFNVVSG